MKSVDAQIILIISVECPICEAENDLLDHSEMTDDGMIYDEAMDDQRGWGKKSFNKSITCANCGTSFTINNINY